jgi:hypothetical protein
VLLWDSHLSPEHLRVFHFVWHLPFDLFGLGDPANSYATTDIILRVIGARKPHHHDKVKTHGEGEIIERRNKFTVLYLNFILGIFKHVQKSQLECVFKCCFPYVVL